MSTADHWAVIIPLANEAPDFAGFMAVLKPVLSERGGGKAYLVVDRASRDHTLDLCREASAQDPRVVTVWAPENRNVVDAYLRGFRAAYDAGHELIIEMDAGLSHDPRAIPRFLQALAEGSECAFGNRFIPGGAMADSSFFRRTLSRTGTILSNTLLGTTMKDMTSGFQGFRREVLGRLLAYPLRSRAHFYQTEVRYLLRHRRYAEVPIHYRAPSSRVSKHAIYNALDTLRYYFLRRLTGRAVRL